MEIRKSTRLPARQVPPFLEEKKGLIPAARPAGGLASLQALEEKRPVILIRRSFSSKNIF